MSTVSYDVLAEAAYEAGLDESAIRADYSGRAMYGDTCLGIVYDSQGDFLRFVIALARADEDAEEWLPQVRGDSMGCGAISYWPGVTVEDVPEEEDDDE